MLLMTSSENVLRNEGVNFMTGVCHKSDINALSM